MNSLNGFWSKTEYDQNGKLIYFEDSDGTITDERGKKWNYH